MNNIVHARLVGGVINFHSIDHSVRLSNDDAVLSLSFPTEILVSLNFDSLLSIISSICPASILLKYED